MTPAPEPSLLPTGFAAIDALGYAAGLLTTMSCVPQVVKSWRTRSVHDLSVVMLVMLSVGLALWIAYGVTRGDWPIMLTNGCSLALWLSLLWLKVRERRQLSSSS
jgi:MtN3 and saliva related transmembrane protein